MAYDCGLTLATGYNRFFGNLGWGICTISFTPLAAGTLSVGVFLYGLEAGVDWYFDEAVLSFGTEALLGAGRFTQLQLGSGPNIIAGTAAPTTGTWAVGDICFRLSPVANETPGWVCTTAGTPGTWKAMASLAA